MLNAQSVGASRKRQNLAVPDTVVAKKCFVLMSSYYVFMFVFLLKERCYLFGLRILNDNGRIRKKTTSEIINSLMHAIKFSKDCV